MLLLCLLAVLLLVYLYLICFGFRTTGIAVVFFPTLFVAFFTGQDARLRLIFADPVSRYAALRSTSVLYGLSPLRGMFDTSKQMQPQIRDRLIAEWGYKCEGPKVGRYKGMAPMQDWYFCRRTIHCVVPMCICSGGAHFVALHMGLVNDRLSSATIVYRGCNVTPI